jgi:hypothetical protein
MTEVLIHLTADLPGRFKAIGLSVVEHLNAITVWCPECSERQDYRRQAEGGWEGKAFLHDVGCPQFNRRKEQS